MNIYAEHDPYIEDRIQFSFKGKSEHVVSLNTPNIAYPGQSFKVLIPKSSNDSVMIKKTQMLTFNLELELKDKSPGIVNNIGRSIIAKKILNLDSEELETIDSSDIIDIYIEISTYLKKIAKIEYYKGFTHQMG